MTASILIVASLDTKAEEANFLRDRLEADGHAVTIADFSILADPARRGDISPDEIAASAGTSLEALRGASSRSEAIATMSRGIGVVAAERYRFGLLSGVIAFGGSGGTTVGSAAMRVLPLGVPKVLISTVASGDTRAFVDIKDVTLVNSVVDFAGLNPISITVLGNAAAALSGMVKARVGAAFAEPATASSLVAATMFGVTTPAVEQARQLLATAGHTIVPFHATGVGGRTMEALIADGFFAGVLDLTTTEWADEVVGGTLSAGPERLSAAAIAGVPQVVAPGALDMVNFWGMAPIPSQFKDRLIHRHSENSYLMRTTAAENAEIGRRIASQLNRARGPVTMLIPSRGYSALDRDGGPFFDPEADTAFVEGLHERIERHVAVEILDAHINDDAFAARAVDLLVASLPPAAGHQQHA